MPIDDASGARPITAATHLLLCYACGHVGDDGADALCQSCGSADTGRFVHRRAEAAGGLVLRRRAGETIEIAHAGETLRIAVADIRGETTGIRFVGPRSFAIRRAELTVMPVTNCGAVTDGHPS